MSARQLKSGFCTVQETTELDREVSQYSVSYSYYNRTGRKITVIDKNGVAVLVDNKVDFDDNSFIIEVKYTFINEAKRRFDEYVHTLPASTNENPFMKALCSAWINQNRGNKFYAVGGSCKIDFRLEWEKIAAAGGTLYIQDLDIVLTCDTGSDLPVHPRTVEGRIGNYAVEKDHSDKPFAYSIRVVDSTNRYPRLYVNIAKTVYPLDSIYDPSMRDGVYVMSPEAEVDESGKKRFKCLHFPFDFERLRDISVYPSEYEARTFGDDSVQRKFELQAIEESTLRLKQEINIQKAQHEKEMIEINQMLERSNAKLKATEHELEMQRIVKKDHLEQKSMDRKDTSEVLKILPAIILGVGSLALAVKKIFF